MTADTAPIEGFAEHGYGKVRDAFVKNFVERGEVGGAVAVYADGKPVVDLWGGRLVKDQQPAGPWQRDTIVRMMSVNKGVTAICTHMLADRGLLDYEKPVAHYWPEFAENGKGAITVRTLMSGMAALVYPDEAEPGMAYEFDQMARALAKQKTNWEPNTRPAYHSATYGNLVGEIIRRITGLTPGQFFRKEIGEPLGVDYWFAVPPAEQHRISEVLFNPGSVTYSSIARGGENKLGRAWKALPTPDPKFRDDPYTFDREMPSGNGRGNARAIGKLFAALSVGGTLDGVTLMSPKTIETMTTLQWDEVCALTDRKFRYAMGLFLSTPKMAWLGPNPRAFGHPGAGGALGFADPDRHLSFSYCTSFMCEGAGLGERCESLVDALYEAVS